MKRHICLFSVLIFLLSACSGGGGGSPASGQNEYPNVAGKFMVKASTCSFAKAGSLLDVSQDQTDKAKLSISMGNPITSVDLSLSAPLPATGKGSATKVDAKNALLTTSGSISLEISEGENSYSCSGNVDNSTNDKLTKITCSNSKGSCEITADSNIVKIEQLPSSADTTTPTNTVPTETSDNIQNDNASPTIPQETGTTATETNTNTGTNTEPSTEEAEPKCQDVGAKCYINDQCKFGLECKNKKCSVAELKKYDTVIDSQCPYGKTMIMDFYCVEADTDITDQIKDENLKKAIREKRIEKYPVDFNCSYYNKNNIPIRWIDVAYAEFNLSGKGIKDISGMEFFKGLVRLDLSNNDIGDITPLAYLDLKTFSYFDDKTKQEKTIESMLDLSGNKNLMNSGFDFLRNLYVRYLYLNNTGLKNLNFLSSDPQNLFPINDYLLRLELRNNSVTDISNIRYVKNLVELDASNNPLDQTKFEETFNYLSTFQDTMFNLGILNLSNTGISSIKGIEKLRLSALNLNGNKNIDSIQPYLDMMKQSQFYGVQRISLKDTAVACKDKNLLVENDACLIVEPCTDSILLSCPCQENILYCGFKDFKRNLFDYFNKPTKKITQ